MSHLVVNYKLHFLSAMLLAVASFFMLSAAHAQLSAQTPAAAAAAASPTAQNIQVLTWWKSTGEHKAVDVLAERLAQGNIIWHDVVIPSGGVGAGIVLKSRVLAGSAPDVAQLKGPLISEWFDLGLINEFKPITSTEKGAEKWNAANNSGKWDKLFFPTVEELVRPNGKLLAIPLGIHRMNLIFYNRKVFDEAGVRPPDTWDEFTAVANKLQRQGIIPLAQSSEPWQLASLFEAVLLSESSPEFYRRAFVKKDPSAFSDIRFARALLRLRILKKFMPSPIKELDWADTTKMVAKGDAAMVVMGDFAKGELNAWGYTTDTNFGCQAVPGTANYHIYNIDTLVFLKKDNAQTELADKIAQILVSPNVQADYNIAKGSVSVLKNADQVKMDTCSRSSWKVFARGSATQVPSLAHDMATDGISKDAIIAELMHFFMDDSVQVGETQRRLIAITHSLPKSR
jgi:glucose/mannose transport system substrate-binding protein